MHILLELPLQMKKCPASTFFYVELEQCFWDCQTDDSIREDCAAMDATCDVSTGVCEGPPMMATEELCHEFNYCYKVNRVAWGPSGWKHAHS
jgi:hypothetical protein